MDFTGLDTLMNATGPAYTSGLQGEQDVINRQRDTLANLFRQEEINKAQQDIAQNAAMNPLRVQQQELANQTTAAELPGRTATSRKLTTEANIAGAGEQDTIALNKQKAAIDRARQEQDLAVQYASTFGTGPDAEARKKAFLDSGVISKDSPMYKAFESTAAADLPDALQKRAQKITEASDAYIKRVGEIRETGKTQITLEQMRINAGKYQKNLRGAQDALEKALVSGSWDKAATAYDAMAQKAMEQKDTESAVYYAQKAKEYSDKYIQSRNAPKAGTVDVGGTAGLPVNPTPTTPIPALRGQPVAPKLPSGWTIKQ